MNNEFEVQLRVRGLGETTLESGVALHVREGQSTFDGEELILDTQDVHELQDWSEAPDAPAALPSARVHVQRPSSVPPPPPLQALRTVSQSPATANSPSAQRTRRSTLPGVPGTASTAGPSAHALHLAPERAATAWLERERQRHRPSEPPPTTDSDLQHELQAARAEIARLGRQMRARDAYLMELEQALTASTSQLQASEIGLGDQAADLLGRVREQAFRIAELEAELGRVRTS